MNPRCGAAYSIRANGFPLQSDPLSPQSHADLRFAATPDYGTALSELSRVWPPLYPSLLWVLGASRVSPHSVNLLLFVISLALLVPVGRQVAPAVHPAW